MINAAAPDGAPPRRIKTVEIINCRFSWFGCEPDRFMFVFPGRKIVIINRIHKLTGLRPNARDNDNKATKWISFISEF